MTDIYLYSFNREYQVYLSYFKQKQNLQQSYRNQVLFVSSKTQHQNSTNTEAIWSYCMLQGSVP